MTTADLVITGARLEPMMDGLDSAADAVAIAGDRLVEIGTSAVVERLIGRGTRVLRLDAQTLLPGFQDAHIHALDGGLGTLDCALFASTSQEEYLATVARYAAEHPDAAWIVGGGWAMPAFAGGIPRREPLDAIVPDRPLLLTSRDGHSAWVNGAALAAAGITADTPDPPAGRIERDAHGVPIGCLQESAIDLVERLVPPPDDARLGAGLAAAQQHLFALGITAWNEAWLRPELYGAYLAGVERGEVHGRVRASLAWDGGRGLSQVGDLDEQRRRAARIPGNHPLTFRAGSVKLFLDGIIESRTAAMLEPYEVTGDAGADAPEQGDPKFTPEELDELVTVLDQHAFDVHFHAIGDRAVRMALDAVAAARRTNGPRDARHHVAHIEVIDPADVPRFAELGVAATMQPYWAAHEAQMEQLRLPLLGPRRATRQFVFASLRDAGARLAGGSDWTVSTANPLEEIEVALRRVRPGHRDNPPFLPDERLDLDTALRAFTIGSAWVHRLERDTGTLEVGKLADLVVLDRDLRACDGLTADARVMRTFVGGTEVFAADGAPATLPA